MSNWVGHVLSLNLGRSCSQTGQVGGKLHHLGAKLGRSWSQLVQAGPKLGPFWPKLTSSRANVVDIGWKRCTWAILIDVAPILCKANSHSAANLLNCKFDVSIFRIISHIVRIKVGSHSSALIHVSKILSETAQYYLKVTQTSASKTPGAQMLSINMPSVWFIESRKPFQVKPAKQSPAHLPGEVRASIWVPRC